MSKKALLIIDMQKGSFTPETPRHDAQGTVRRINVLADFCRARGWPVIHIQHDGTGTGAFEKGSWDWELLDDLAVKLGDLRVDKTANDAFYRSGLQSLLTEQNVTELYITGCATDFCVASTIQSALTKDYAITVVADGHTTGDRLDLTAVQMIAHYHWVWQHMIPTRGSIALKSCAEMVGVEV